MNLRRPISSVLIAALAVGLLLLIGAAVRVSWPGSRSATAVADANRNDPPLASGAPVAAPAAALKLPVQAVAQRPAQQAAQVAVPLPSESLTAEGRVTEGLVTEVVAGAIVTQTFELQNGWNAIFLGVEPVNASPLVNQGTADKPVWVHEKSTMEAVFGALAAQGLLESVWTYNQPVAHKDYIVDPGEGLWDAPGWLRYIPKEAVGTDGQSKAFLSNLVSLHANTGYLVKLKNVASFEYVTVYGTPAPGHLRWAPGAYNLAGFPLGSQGSTVETFTAAGTPGAPLTEVRALTQDGKWTAALAGSAMLAPGVAYLVRVADEPAPANYTAPLDVLGLLPEGLKFRAGTVGQKVTLGVKNTSPAQAAVTLSLAEGAGSRVALHVMETPLASGGTLEDLRDGPVSFDLASGDGRQLEFQVPIDEQAAAGEALLYISSDALGVRWTVPVTAEPGSVAGLWVGDILVNDVSEARLGATDFANDLTVALGPMGASGVRGSAQVHDEASGSSHTLHFTVTLTLPELASQTVTAPTAESLFMRGHVFVDENQNGQRDGGEPGFEGVEVQAVPTSGATRSGVTGADGGYLIDTMAAGTYELTAPAAAAAGAPMEGYTLTFPIAIPNQDLTKPPLTAMSAWPVTVTLGTYATAGGQGATAVDPTAYLSQVLPSPILPYYDANDNLAQPPLNFGYVRVDVAAVYAGTCDARREKLFDLGYVKNGQLVASAANQELGALVGDSHVLVTWKDQAVACGNLVRGAPTLFSDGRGSQAKLRVLLRVSETRETALLPYYAVNDGAGVRRISSAAFMATQPMTITGPFGTVGAGLEFNLTLPANDPLNPYKHKYNPDHDNLDRKFEELQEESFDIQRKITFILQATPWDGDTTAAAALDWGGAVWGGEYREVIDNLHKNSITVRGQFVIRHVLTAEQLVKQEYDK